MRRTGSLTACVLLVAVLAACSGTARPLASPTKAITTAAGPGSSRTWMFTKTALTFILDNPGSRQAVAGDRIFEILRDKQQPSRDVPVVPTMAFPSYAALQTTLASGDLPHYIKAVIYDAEAWSFTPVAEQKNPALYYARAAALVHAHGLLLIATPAVNLVKSHLTTPSASRTSAYISLGLAADASRHADVFEIQSQSLERDTTPFAAFVDAATRQARASNPRIVVLAGLSSNPPGPLVTAAELAAAIKATSRSAQGYWVNIPGQGPQCSTCNPEDPQVAISALASGTTGSR